MSDQMTTTAFHQSERSGSPSLVLIFAALLVAAAIAFAVLPRDQAGTLIIGCLALLAVIGIFALFGYAIGIIQFAGKAVKNDVTRIVCDSGPEGMLVTDAGGKFLYANDTYLKFSRARGASDLRGIERLFSGSPEVSETVYRLAQAARDGKRVTEELRLSPPLDGSVDEVGWYRVKVRPAGARERGGRAFGPSPTSPASASATRTSFRNCSTPSTSSIMRRPASSPATRRATSAI